MVDILYRCPRCFAEVSYFGKDSYCKKCYRAYAIPSRGEQSEYNKIDPTRQDNLFDPYSQHYVPNHNHCYEYQIFFSYANVEPDMNIAKQLADKCVQVGWRTFFAPESLRYKNKNQEYLAPRWSQELELALLSSCHVLCVLSNQYRNSTYCELELNGAMQIAILNDKRHIVVIPSDGTCPTDAPTRVSPYLCKNDWRDIHERFSKALQTPDLRLGRVGYSPTYLHDPLPLTENLAALPPVPLTWIENFAAWRLLPGTNRNLKLRVFEDSVRELMVLLLKGVNPTEDSIYWPPLGDADKLKAEALEAARYLVAHDIRPYTGFVEKAYPKRKTSHEPILRIDRGAT